MNALNRDFKKLVKLYKNTFKEKVNEDYHRLKFHLMPPVGWLNDTNGLCEFKGKYYIFYQYSPFDSNGGTKFWGLYTTKDFINWKDEGAKIFSDQPYDCHGAYSGSTLVHNDKMYIFYTGNVKNIGNHDYINSGREHNTILIVSEDGENFENKTLLMRNSDYPDNLTCHVRDPKVFIENDKFYMVQGARDKQNVGQILLFESHDLKNWKFINTIKSKEIFGYMWECPDLIKLENKNILIMSPQGIEPDDIKYNNIYQTGYYFIEGDYKTSNYKLSDFNEIDRGFDFYASQTFVDSKKRTILIGWMGLPDIQDLYTNPTTEYHWQHALTIPRELKINNNKLIQIPICELESLRKTKKDFKVEKTLVDEAFDTFEINIDFEKSNDFKLIIKKGAILEYSSEEKLFSLSFNEIGFGRTKRSCKLERIENLRAFVDTSSIEIFLNNGEEVFTSRFYPDKNVREINLTGENLKVEIYEMGSFNIKGD